jgi:anti-anti-sigma factor
VTAESTVVFSDHVARVTTVRTTAADEWRAALSLSGELDIANAQEVQAELDAHLAAGRRVIRVDTTDVSFMDSTAIGVLISASTRCREQHGSLIVTGAPRALRRLLQIAGLDHLLLVDTAHCG